MRRAVLLAVCGIGAVSLPVQPQSAVASSPTAQGKINPDEVKLVNSKAEVQYCTPIGHVEASSGLNFEGRVRTGLRKKAAELGANTVLVQRIDILFGAKGFGDAYLCTAESVAAQTALARLQAQAARPIHCVAETDCESKWSRATLWLQDHCTWKVTTTSEMLIATEGPMDTDRPAFEVKKMPTGDGKTYQIAIRVLCGQVADENSPCSERKKLELRSSFVDFVTQPPGK
jgi:hypothetical protein